MIWNFSLSKIGNGYLVIFKYKEFSSEYFLNQHCGIILELIEIQILLPVMKYLFANLMIEIYIKRLAKNGRSLNSISPQQLLKKKSKFVPMSVCVK